MPIELFLKKIIDNIRKANKEFINKIFIES